MNGPVWDKHSAIPPRCFPNRHLEAAGSRFSKRRAQCRHKAEKLWFNTHSEAVKTKAS